VKARPRSGLVWRFPWRQSVSRACFSSSFSFPPIGPGAPAGYARRERPAARLQAWQDRLLYRLTTTTNAAPGVTSFCGPARRRRRTRLYRPTAKSWPQPTPPSFPTDRASAGSLPRPTRTSPGGWNLLRRSRTSFCSSRLFGRAERVAGILAAASSRAEVRSAQRHLAFKTSRLLSWHWAHHVLMGGLMFGLVVRPLRRMARATRAATPPREGGERDAAWEIPDTKSAR